MRASLNDKTKHEIKLHRKLFGYPKNSLRAYDRDELYAQIRWRKKLFWSLNKNRLKNYIGEKTSQFEAEFGISIDVFGWDIKYETYKDFCDRVRYETNGERGHPTIQQRLDSEAFKRDYRKGKDDARTICGSGDIDNPELIKIGRDMEDGPYREGWLDWLNANKITEIKVEGTDDADRAAVGPNGADREGANEGGERDGDSQTAD